MEQDGKYFRLERERLRLHIVQTAAQIHQHDCHEPGKSVIDTAQAIVEFIEGVDPA